MHSSNFRVVGFTEAAPLSELGALAREPGVYTVQVWRDSGRSTLTEPLLQLSAFQP